MWIVCIWIVCIYIHYIIYEPWEHFCICRAYLLEIPGLGLKSVECVRLLALEDKAFPVSSKIGIIIASENSSWKCTLTILYIGWCKCCPDPSAFRMDPLGATSRKSSISPFRGVSTNAITPSKQIHIMNFK